MTTAVWIVIIGLALIASKGHKVWAYCLLALVVGLYFGHSPMHNWALTVMHWLGSVGSWVQHAAGG